MTARFVHMKIDTYSDGTFAPFDHGRLATVVAATDWNGRINDLVAWIPEAAGRWWTHRGLAQLLGEHAIFSADWRNEAINLYSTPASWLDANDEMGVCILDWRADPRAVLSPVPAVVCETPTLERRLWAAIRAHSQPSFTVTWKREAHRAA